MEITVGEKLMCLFILVIGWLTSLINVAPKNTTMAMTHNGHMDS